ncbi:MAG TPA: DinB family protein [Acidobacteriota bacterium]|nr:DinB family protein [Acidobacteriota bacterium]
MTDKKSNLQFLVDANQTAVRRLIDDVTEDESLVRGQDNLLHIRWNVGHIVYNAFLVLRTLGIDAPLPGGWHELFRRGCDFSEDADAYPSMAELREKLCAYYDQINARLAVLTDTDLDGIQDSEPVFEDTSALNTSLFFCTHEFYHAGQIAVMRRILGRERTFG